MPVERPDVVDLLVTNPKTREVMLIMVETRDWTTTPEALQQLNAKFAGYAECILSGALVQQYPKYAGCPLRIHLDHFSPLTPEVSAILQQWAAKLSGIPVAVYSNRLHWNLLARLFPKIAARFKAPYQEAVLWKPEPGAASALLTRDQFLQEVVAALRKKIPSIQV
jgi:hypothetical protein